MGAVELFVVGAFFVWLVISGKLRAVIEAGFSNPSTQPMPGNRIVNPP